MYLTPECEARAMKFAAILLDRFNGCYTLRQFSDAIAYYNATHTRKIKWAHGVSRVVIIRADYVIKFDIRPTSCFSDGRAGNCLTERAVFERAEKEGWSYLLAEPSVHVDGKRVFSIMPRVNGVGLGFRDMDDYLTYDEMDILYHNIRDLHCGNVGYYKGKPVVIDYAWDNTK